MSEVPLCLMHQRVPHVNVRWWCRQGVIDGKLARERAVYDRLHARERRLERAVAA